VLLCTDVFTHCIYYVRQVDRLGVLMLNGKAPFVVPDDEASGIPRAYGRSYAEITVQVCGGCSTN
jgi:hypothetical protein